VRDHTALVLAGTRGEGDPLARAQAARHRALIDVAGVPMLLRVVRALRACPEVGAIAVSIDEPAGLDSVPELAGYVRDGSLAVHRSLSSPSRSALDALDRLAPPGPLLVTTADHPLLTPAIVGHFLAAAERSRADVAVGLVERGVVQARFPHSTRTWLRLRGEDFSGANLFLLRTPRARRAVEFWKRAESFRKRPWRLVSVFGPVSLLLFLLRRLDLDAALARASRVIGAQIAAVRLPFAEAAVDVDRPSDLDLVTEVLAAAQSGSSPSSTNAPRAGS
jgi:GTP:adenosylcobinamide-phosphate guanylyltransferase